MRIGGDRGNLHRVRDLGRTRAIIARKAKAQQRATDLKPVLDQLRAKGATSLGKIAAGLNERRIPSPGGCSWSAMAVSRVLTQLEAGR